MAAPPLEAATAALRQSQAQNELLLRSLQQNLTVEEDVMLSFSHEAGAGASTAAGLGAAGEDWSFIHADQWGNIAPVMKKAMATLGRTLSHQTSLVLATATKTDETHKRVCRIEDTMLTVQKSIEALATRSGDHSARIERLDAHRGATADQVSADFTALREKMDRLQNDLNGVKMKTSAFSRVEDGVQRLGLELASVRGEDLPAIKQRVSNLSHYETGLQSALSQLKELQETAVMNRYAAPSAGPAGLGHQQPQFTRSCGRWLWEGRESSRTGLVLWDSRTLELGDALRWTPDSKRYVIEIRRAGLYKISSGLVTTNASVSTDSMMMYIDDDSLLSTVHAASFVAHSPLHSSTARGGSAVVARNKQQQGSRNAHGSSNHAGRVRGGHSANHCCAADCGASCYTSLSSNDIIYIPGRALLCICCTAKQSETVCGFLEVQEFA